MSLDQDHKTKHFLEKIDLLIGKGIVKNHAEVVQALNWNKSVMSSVKNGNLPVPQHIYNKFREVYGEYLNDKPSLNDEGYKDRYINTLEQQIKDKDRQLLELKERMDSRTLQITEQIDRLAANLKEHDQTARIALAYAKTLYLTLQGHMAKVEKAPLQRVQDDMDKTLVQQVKEVLSGNGN